ncbi:large ribosomal subunit protein bL9m [Hyperolius riggenbachi]|uniref:large ribosomal subunit protein bL9m n=1 Tax=Hyperolius riggenbachi TaxID=752182 RepID=UPI0035A27E89
MLQNVARQLLSLTGIRVTPCRGTVIVERWYNVPLPKEGKEPYLNPRRHSIYRVVEDTKHGKKDKMELILTQSIRQLGSRGDLVQVEKAMGRNKLLPQGLAVYPSPENKLMFEEERKRLQTSPGERQQTWTGEMTVEFLKNTRAEIRMREDFDWTLTKEIVCRQLLRNLDLMVPVEALKIPDEPISTFGTFWCEVTVNGTDTVRMPMDVVKFDGPRSTRYRYWLAKNRANASAEAQPPQEGSDAPESTSEH